MNRIVAWAVRSRIVVWFLTAIVVVAGVYSYRTLPLESVPDITIPNVFITTNYRGASPEDVETSITVPIEDELQGISGVKKIVSVSSEGSSFINVEFLTGTDIDEALDKVKDRVDRARAELPSDLEDEPSVEELNISEMPILVLSLSGSAGVRALTEIAEDLADAIEALPGVLEVEISGKVEREIQIQLDAERLALYRIPITQIQSVVYGESQNTSGGTFRTTDGRYQLRVPGEFHDVEEVEGIVVATVRGAPVYLRDIGRVVDGIKDLESISRTNAQRSVTLAVKKRTGENIVSLVDAVNALVQQARASWPPGTDVVPVMDHAKDIRLMLEDLENNMLSGFFLVVGIVWLVMGLRNAILVSLSIPLSMLMSFVVLDWMGVTLNMVVLFSLTLALGMLVDNAIVIIENIYRFMEQGVPREEAAIAATGEVGWAILGSALVTIAAFVPLLVWPGIMGEFMVYLPITVIVTLSCCLFVAILINPVSAAVFIQADSGGRRTTAQAVMSGGEHPMLAGGGAVVHAYRRLLRGALRMRLAVVVLAAGATVATALLWFYRVGIETPMEFFPSVDPARAYVNVKLPKGADLQYGDRLIREISERIRSLGSADVEHVFEKAAAATGELDIFGGSANQVGVQFVELEKRKQSSREALRTVEQRLRGIAGAEILVEAEEGGPPTGAPINIEISGDDFRVLGRIAAQVKELIQQIQFTQNVRVDYEEGAPTVRVHVDRKRAGLFGLSTNDIGFALKAAINGINVATYREGDEDFDIVVRLVDEQRRLIETLRQLFVPSPSGTLIPLTTLCDIRYEGGLGRITRIDRRRVVTVKADADKLRTTGVALRLQAERLLASSAALAQLPPGYRYRFTGEQEHEREAQEFLSWAMGMAVMLILFLLVVQFNSMYYPAVILSTVVLSQAGVFLGLAVCRMPFGLIMTGVGVISLIGVVVNNAIVMVDYILQLQSRGMSVNDAIIAGAATRLRPVLLGAFTTVLGLVPMLVGISFDFLNLRIVWASESSQWWMSMAVAVSFGLSLATMLTMIVVPVLFSLVCSVQGVGSSLGPGLWTAGRALRSLWWRPFDRVFGTDHARRGLFRSP